METVTPFIRRLSSCRRFLCRISSGEDKENGSGNSTDSSPPSGSSSSRSSSGRLAPREGQILDKIIQAHAIEAEEALHSSMEEEDSVAGNLMSTHKAFRSLPSLPAQPSNASSQYSTEDMIRPTHGPPVKPRNRGSLGLHTPLSKAKSTPLLLNQIFEERESDLEDSPTASPRIERNRKPTGGGVMKPKRNTRRLSPVPSTGSRRSSSCSSSDEDELEKHMRRLKTNQAQAGCKKPSSRRGSHDDGSSEGDDGTGCAGGGRKGLGRTTYGSSVNSSNNESLTKGEGSCQQGHGGKTNCLSLNGFVPVEKHSLTSIDESNKENVSENTSSDGEGNSLSRKTTQDRLSLNKENQMRLSPEMNGEGSSCEDHDNRKQTSLLQDSYKTTQDTLSLNQENQRRLSTETNGDESAQSSGKRSPLIEDCRRSSSFLRRERKGSAAKYIHHCTCEDNRTLEGTCKCYVPNTELEYISMNMRKKDVGPAGSGHQTLRVLKHPSVANVSSACCQIF